MARQKIYRVLSIDGGGVRGLIPIQCLKSIEERLRKKVGNPSANLIDYFDLVSGVSVGSILVGMMVVPELAEIKRPKYTIGEIHTILTENIPYVFRTSTMSRLLSKLRIKHHDTVTDHLENLLNHYLGDHYLSESICPCITLAYDVMRRNTRIFNSVEAQQKEWLDFLLKDVCRAGSAAPTYFDPANIASKTGVCYPCIDGGVSANNPALFALIFARLVFNVKTSHVAVLSLGCGKDEKAYYYQDAKDFGKITWIRPLLDFIFSASSETIEYFAQLAFDMRGVPDNLLRLSPTLKQLPPGMSTDISDSSSTNVAGMLELGQELIEKNVKNIDRFLDLMIEQDEIEKEEEKKANQSEEKKPDNHTESNP